MTTLMDDLRLLYNDLTTFNEGIMKTNFPLPIKVQYSEEYKALFFEQKGKSMFSHTPIYYSLGIWDDLSKPTWLLPEDYQNLMNNLQFAIMDSNGYLLKDRTCVSPENYGFDIWACDDREIWKGPEIIASIRFISGKNWLWKKYIEKKYKVKLTDNFNKNRWKK